MWAIEGLESWTEDVAQALDALDNLGVVVSVAAGNEGKLKPAGKSASYTPNILAARANSPLIIVGAVNENGQLAMITSVGSAAVPIHTYAMGKGIMIVDMSVEENVPQDGTTFSAAIVVSCYLPCVFCQSHPHVILDKADLLAPKI